MSDNGCWYEKNQLNTAGNNIGYQNNFPMNPYSSGGVNQDFNRLTPMKPVRVYHRYDRFFAAAALVLGFIMIKVVINTASSGGGFLTTVLFLAITLFNYFYCKKSGMIGSGDTKFIFLAALVLSGLFIVTDNYYVKTIDFWLVTFSNLYFVYASYNSNNNSIIHNLLKAVLISPFCEFLSLFEALFSKHEKTDKNRTGGLKRNVIPVLLGLAFSIPVCAAVMVLLSSSDQNFGRMFGKIITECFDRFVDKFVVNAFLFVFSIPIGMYIFGAVYSRAYKMNHETELVHGSKKSKRILPSSACNAFLTPLIMIYTAFVLTQISYLFNTFDTLNENFSYSEYARSGFFELCFVAMINLSVISAVMFFIKLKDRKLPMSVKLFIIMFSVLTLCLIVTALVKMMMYINIYGMTPLRVYTSIFMIYLFVLFIVLIFKQFKFRISFTKIAYSLAVFAIAAMSLIPVDGLIASYNIEKFKQGKIGWMGYAAMEELDASAVRVFAGCDFKAVKKNSDINYPEDHTIERYFESKENIGDMDIYDFNLTRYFASLIVKEKTVKQENY